MPNPPTMDPATSAKAVRPVEAERLVTLKDDSTQPPPTIGIAPWQGILFGALMGQPSSRTETFSHTRSTFQAIFRMVFAGALIAGFFLLLNMIFS